MKKGIIFILLIVFLVFTSTEIVFAFSGSYGQVFGGKIINTKAAEIKELELSGYICVVNGTSVTVKPIKGPATFIIPFTTISKTKKIPLAGKWIMGKYSGKTIVTCALKENPEIITTITLDTITLFGTS